MCGSGCRGRGAVAAAAGRAGAALFTADGALAGAHGFLGTGPDHKQLTRRFSRERELKHRSEHARQEAELLETRTSCVKQLEETPAERTREARTATPRKTDALTQKRETSQLHETSAARPTSRPRPRPGRQALEPLELRLPAPATAALTTRDHETPSPDSDERDLIRHREFGHPYRSSRLQTALRITEHARPDPRLER